jgi:flagellar biosynthesis/type III secretory pathway M-ring protein FliF/YscJ
MKNNIEFLQHQNSQLWIAFLIVSFSAILICALAYTVIERKQLKPLFEPKEEPEKDNFIRNLEQKNRSIVKEIESIIFDLDQNLTTKTEINKRLKELIK